MRSMLDLPQAAQDEIHDNASLVTDRMAVADIGSVLNFLDGEPAARKGPKGSVGYCLGGRLALCGRGRVIPDEFRASASLHGTTWSTTSRRIRRTASPTNSRAKSTAASPRRISWAPPDTDRDAGASLCKDRGNVRYRADRPSRHGARLFAAGPRHLSQGQRQPRLGEHLRDVQAGAELASALRPISFTENHPGFPFDC